MKNLKTKYMSDSIENKYRRLHADYIKLKGEYERLKQDLECVTNTANELQESYNKMHDRWWELYIKNRPCGEGKSLIEQHIKVNTYVAVKKQDDYIDPYYGVPR
jgi:predicted nuclease with TOPRIM domain